MMKLKGSLRFVVCVCLVLLAKSALAAVDTNRVVVLISIDGLAADYLDDPKAEMPTLRQLAKEGARAKSMKAVTPSVTWPNHTTLVTGDYPARHGVVGNNYYDRAAGKKIALIADPIYDKDEIVKVPTIYDAAKAAGLRTAAFRWPATRNARTLDWTVPDANTEEVYAKYTTPELLQECEAANIPLYKDAPGAKFNPASPRDEASTRALNLILHKYRPGLALLHIIDVDHTSHENGPRTEAAYKAVKVADSQVRMVWEELQKDFPGRATLFITSDHGFSPINKTILPNVLFVKAGLLDSEKKNADGKVQLVTQGGSAFIYVKDQAHRDEVLAQVHKALKGLEGIEQIVDSSRFNKIGVADPKVDPHAPDLLLYAKFGYTFGDTAAGALPFVEKPERRGSHGHNPEIPELHATFVAWGAGIKPGVQLGEIQNTGVAPTIAKVLGVELPNTDGKPLDKILAK